ncbi:hypothetical protein AVEN_38665-1 [Araneus ventricosus]|uniref:Uncharacterized protein n=1 Tax=Araneus ventricosus TaxID=182803 RepID=A0A4Y2T6L1_ARAVE|nr:hypothetical protein AVEN_38665-1 [Araneus ventricosus]
MQQSAHEFFYFSSQKCVLKNVRHLTVEASLVELTFSLTASSQLARKVEGGTYPVRPGPHRVQWTDLSYFCGEVRNTHQSALKPSETTKPTSVDTQFLLYQKRMP